MNLTITNYKENNLQQYPTFKGPLDGTVTNLLRTLDTNEMANAVLIDVGAMVAPRTYIDTKKRNKYAGTETFFREISGTFINCLAAGFLAIPIAKYASRYFMPDVKINHRSWFSNDALLVLKNSWDASNNNIQEYVKNIFTGMSGRDGKHIVKWNNINWQNIDWIDEKKWDNLHWENPKFKQIQDSLKTPEEIINTLSNVIENRDISSRDKKNIFRLIEARVTNAMGVNRNINVTVGEHNMNASLSNIIRDTYDMGKDVLTNKNINIDAALKKLAKINKVKTLGALTLASILGLTNQYINRQITAKRTGSTKFVGDLDYSLEVKNEKQQNNKTKSGFLIRKIAASAGIIAMAAGVMKIKNPKDFIRKLEFTGPITSGNAIKTVYTATLVGRFMAADNDTELRESVTRDYLGFLNWLVLGGFAAKGVANLLDRNQQNLFNINKTGSGIKHWLNDLSLKTHTEIAAKGREFARKNLWKLNVAHVAGLAYSTIALGVVLPLLNIAITNHNKKTNQTQQKSTEKINIKTMDFYNNLPVAFEAFKRKKG